MDNFVFFYDLQTTRVPGGGAGVSRPRKHLIKAMLLSMDQASAREQSLTCHLALVACRGGHGNGHLFNEMMRTVCRAWFLQRDGSGSEPVGRIKTAEYAVEAALELAHATNRWVLAEDAVPFSRACWRCTMRNSPPYRCTR
jgi:hypothetical protein